jgi:hypothetical protein
MDFRIVEDDQREGDVARDPMAPEIPTPDKRRKALWSAFFCVAVFFLAIGYLIGLHDSDAPVIEKAIKQARVEERAKIVAEIRSFGKIDGMQVAYVNVKDK